MRIFIEQKFDILEGFNSKVLSNIYHSKENRNLFPILTTTVIATDAKTPYRGIIEKFLIDTGASMTILRSDLGQFVKDLVVDNIFRVQYGSGKPRDLNVYKITLLVKGIEIPIKAAYDPEYKYENSVLGNTYGLSEFGILVTNHRKKFSKIIKF